jgi:hypothetical protein
VSGNCGMGPGDIRRQWPIDYNIGRFFTNAEALISYEGTTQMQNPPRDVIPIGKLVRKNDGPKILSRYLVQSSSMAENKTVIIAHLELVQKIER